jgi:tetratricopeptide (TPR) repeat protein
MIVCDARLGNDSAAEQAIAELKNDYPNALKQIAMCEYELGHLAAAEWATNERLVKFPDDTECFDILNKVARSYQKNEDHEKSIELYQRVLASSTDQNQQLWSVRGIAVSSAWLGGDEEVLSKVNFICNNFKTHRIAGKSIFIIGEQYYFKGVKAAAQSNKELAKDYCQKAISIWNKNITEINDPHYICLATYFTAVALEQTGKHEDAISYYKKTLQDFPDYDKAWNAQYRIARCYDQMCKRKLISKDEAGTYISQACQKVKENYPDCKVINFAEKLNKKYQTEVVK